MGYTLITNGKPRQLLAKAELTAKQAADFDYVEDEDYSPRFVEYRGAVYDTSDCQAIRPIDCHGDLPIGWSYPVTAGEPLARYDAIATESYFSAVAFRFVSQGEMVIVARIYT